MHTFKRNTESISELLFRLSERLARKNLKPYDVGGSGDCFFKSVSHQLFGTPDRHLEIRLAGVNHLTTYPEYYIEFNVHDSWLDYLRMMSKLGTWCDHIIIQAVANAFTCIIDITESAIGFEETTLVRPRAVQQHARLIHIGHLDEMHYVSTSPMIQPSENQTNCSNKEKQKTKKHEQYLKRKASETKDKRDKRLAQSKEYREKKKIISNSVQNPASAVEKQKTKKHEQYLKRKASETKEQRDKRLARGKEYREKKKTISNSVQNPVSAKKSVQNPVSAAEKQKTKKHEQYLKRKSYETKEKTDKRLVRGKEYKNKKSELINMCYSKQSSIYDSVPNSATATKIARPLSKGTYFSNFNILKISEIHEQAWAKENMNNFHKSILYSTIQCTVCNEAWPTNEKLQAASLASYVCKRCKGDKETVKKFSKENFMIPSSVPLVLEHLTQVEEMLIARALPITHVYLKPGGQRGYSGHCINLPQNVSELAQTLPRYPKDISVIVVKMKGKDNNFKDVTVRRQAVADALQWLIQNNPHYKCVVVNQDSLNLLPENGIPQELLSVDTENIDENYLTTHDLGPQNEDDIVYNEGTQMSSFLPIPEGQSTSASRTSCST
jgi:hypothetical protein